MSTSHEIGLAAEPIIEQGSLYLTNSILASFVTTIFFLVFVYLVRRKMGIIPSRWQVAAETIVTLFLEKLSHAYGSEKLARKHLPILLTLFFFIFIANQFGVFPLVNDFVTHEGVKIFRVPTSDLIVPLGMALIAIVGSHILALTISPFNHISRFINIKPMFKARSFHTFFLGFLDFFLGILEFLGEVSKILSLSCRLFGNIFSGEVIYVIITGLASFTQIIIPIPFVFLGFFVGIIQAFVFTLLALNFMAANIRHALHPAH